MIALSARNCFSYSFFKIQSSVIKFVLFGTLHKRVFLISEDSFVNSMEKVWIVGANGRVGHELLKIFMQKEIEVFYTDEDEVDIVKLDDVINYADLNRPHDIINCAGMTDVIACENNIDSAFKVNAIGARNLSIAARKVGARIIQLSTDDVFDGQSKQPYTEFDIPNPRTVYGKSKLAGENFVRDLTTKHIIIRSSWIFGSGENYVENLLEEANRNYNIGVAKDQFASPTNAKYLAEMILYLMEFGEYGLFHVTCQGECSRFEFAEEVLRISQTKAKLHPVSSEQDKLTSFRPSYSVLDNLMLRLLGIPLLPPWQRALEDYIEEYKKEKQNKKDKKSEREKKSEKVKKSEKEKNSKKQ